MSDCDQLVKIPASNWLELRDLYQLDHHVAYHTVNNYVHWYRKDKDLQDLEIFSLNGNWKSDGTFSIVDRYQLLIYSLDSTNNILERALKLLDWSKGFKVSAFLHRHRPAVLAAVQFKKLDQEYDSLTYLYFLSQEKSKKLKLNIPNKVILKSLSLEDADTINNVWPNKHDGSLLLIKRLIDWNPNVGAFDENGTLMGWCLRLQAGALGALQVQESFKRRGIGSLVVTAMAKILADLNMDTFALVGHANESSQKMFEKLGFSYDDDAYWLRTLPMKD